MDQITTELFIGGEPRHASAKATYEILNPARPSDVVGHAAAANLSDVDAAMDAAQAAFPGWAGLSVDERAGYLHKIAKGLNADETETTGRTRLFTREHGKTLFETNIEIGRLVDRFAQVAGFAGRSQSLTGSRGPGSIPWLHASHAV